MYLQYIHFCLQQKCEISTVDCTQIKDLDNLCVRPTIDYLQAKLWDFSTTLYFATLRSVPVEMTYKENNFVKWLDVNGK